MPIRVNAFEAWAASAASLVLAVCIGCSPPWRNPELAPSPSATSPSKESRRLTGPKSENLIDLPVVSAHRGGVQSPNSTATLKRALAETFTDEIETDVQATSDGVLVISHDDKLGPTCSETGLQIHEVTYSRLSTVRCSGEPIPRVAEILALVASHPEKDLRIEVKVNSGASDKAMRVTTKALTKMIDDARVTRQTIIQSFSWRKLTKVIAEVGTGVRIGALDEHATYAGIKQASDLGVHDYVVKRQYLDAGMANYARASGLRVGVWDVKSAAEYQELRAVGGQIAVTDHPEVVRSGEFSCTTTNVPLTSDEPGLVTVAPRRPVVFPLAPSSVAPQMGRLSVAGQMRVEGGGSSTTVKLGPSMVPVTKFKLLPIPPQPSLSVPKLGMTVKLLCR